MPLWQAFGRYLGHYEMNTCIRADDYYQAFGNDLLNLQSECGTTFVLWADLGLANCSTSRQRKVNWAFCKGCCHLALVSLGFSLGLLLLDT